MYPIRPSFLRTVLATQVLMNTVPTSQKIRLRKPNITKIHRRHRVQTFRLSHGGRTLLNPAAINQALTEEAKGEEDV